MSKRRGSLCSTLFGKEQARLVWENSKLEAMQERCEVKGCVAMLASFTRAQPLPTGWWWGKAAPPIPGPEQSPCSIVWHSIQIWKREGYIDADSALMLIVPVYLEAQNSNPYCSQLRELRKAQRWQEGYNQGAGVPCSAKTASNTFI